MAAEASRRPLVGVMGSGSEPHHDLAVPLGRLIAQLGCNLLTGGGSGVMEAVSAAFHAVEGRRGLVIGILPGAVDAEGLYAAPPGYPNRWVEVVIRTHLPLSGEQGTAPMSRNHINVLSSDAIVALPGSAGTRSEAELALRYGKPLIAHLGAAGAIPGLPLEAPVARRLEDVERFIRDATGLR